MTQRNIEIMDRIVDEMVAGKKLSEALKAVYYKRSIAIPFNDTMFNVDVRSLNLATGASNALMRMGLRTINDVIKYGEEHPIMGIRNFGMTSGMKMFEEILDFAWRNMSKEERVEFLVDTVQRNEYNLRAELI